MSIFNNITDKLRQVRDRSPIDFTPPQLERPLAGQLMSKYGNDTVRGIGDTLFPKPTWEDFGTNFIGGPAAGMAKIWGKGAERMAGPLYHSTFTSRLPSILKEGLRPRAETGISSWAGEAMSKQPGVYFARDPRYAAEMAEMAPEFMSSEEAEALGDPVLIKVKQLLTKNFLHDEDIYNRQIVPEGRKPTWVDSFALDNFGSGLREYEGLGTIAHKGDIPPEELEILGVGEKAFKKAYYKERDKFDNMIDKLRAKPNVPWWAK